MTDTIAVDAPTSLYYMSLATQAAEKLELVVEATSPEQATELANAIAIDRGHLHKDELDEKDAETFFYEPVLIMPMTGTPGLRMED